VSVLLDGSSVLDRTASCALSVSLDRLVQYVELLA
jgi:hypothetical protein